jgi:hypothetical protein
MEIPLNLVDDNKLLLNKGDGLIFQFSRDDDKCGLIIVCPKCGKVTSGRHIYNPETKSLTPSIVHNKDLGGCGWHGWLTNGIFTEC